jgi:frataxin-like iron-binding protein CyaY
MEYHKNADSALEEILTNLETTESIDRIPGSDLLFASGVLTLSLGSHG